MLQMFEECGQLEPYEVVVEKLPVMINKKVEVKTELSLTVDFMLEEVSQKKYRPILAVASDLISAYIISCGGVAG